MSKHQEQKADKEWNKRYNELLAFLREDNPGIVFPKDLEIPIDDDDVEEGVRSIA